MIAVYLVLLVVGAVLATAFPVYYQLRARWRETPMGKHLMAFMVMLALLLDFTVLRPWIPREVRLPIALVLVAGFDYLLAQRLWLLVRAQRGDR